MRNTLYNIPLQIGYIWFILRLHMDIIRGTTPTLSFKINNMDLTGWSATLTIAEDFSGSHVIATVIPSSGRVTISEDTIYATLTKDETWAIPSTRTYVYAQIYIEKDGQATATKPVQVNVIGNLMGTPE